MSTWVFLSNSISSESLSSAEKSLEIFYVLFQSYYGLPLCSINLHCLIHYAFFVRRFGPLFVASCFPFENMNHLLVKHVQGTNQVVDKMVFSLVMIRNLDAYVAKNLWTFSPDVRRYFESMGLVCSQPSSSRDAATRLSSDTLTQISEHVFAVGLLTDISLNQRLITVIARKFSDVPLRLQKFKRLIKDGCLFHSEHYSRPTGNSFTILQFEPAHQVWNHRLLCCCSL